MSIEIKDVTAELPIEVPFEVTILPKYYTHKNNEHYDATSTSFLKLAQGKLDIGYLTQPKTFIDQRAAEWFCPTLLITAQALAHNPNLVSIMCSVIANYITDFFKGKPSPEVNVTVVYKKTKRKKVTQISYQGDVEGLGKLENQIHEVVKK